MIYVFLNRLSNNGKGGDAQPELEKIFEGHELKFIDITSVTNAADSCRMLSDNDKIVNRRHAGSPEPFVYRVTVREAAGIRKILCGKAGGVSGTDDRSNITRILHTVQGEKTGATGLTGLTG